MITKIRVFLYTKTELFFGIKHSFFEDLCIIDLKRGYNLQFKNYFKIGGLVEIKYSYVLLIGLKIKIN
jgi:hypothetical protein